MSLELVRDEAGRPVAIRIRVEEFSLRALVRPLGQALAALPALFAWVLVFLRSGIPRVSTRRDVEGVLTGIVLHFQTPVRPQTTAPPPESGDTTQEGDTDQDGEALHQKWVIEPAHMGYAARFEELWRYRKIMWFFGSRAITERYEGTTLGVLWLILRPAAPLLITTFVFGALLKVASDGIPYILFFLGGMSCWRVFERSMVWVTKSLEQNRGLLKKVYFPRLIAPISSVAPALVEFGVLILLMILFTIGYRVFQGVWYLRVGLQNFAALLALVLTVFFAISLGLWTSVLQVRSRDIQYTIRYVMQFWLYITPVIYPMSALPAKYHFLVYLNPMAPLVEMYKWGMLGLGTFPGLPLLASMTLTVLTFLSGLVYFDRSEAGSVDQL